MTIKKDLVYTIKEASNILGVHSKKLHRIAQSKGIKKIDNRYLFGGDFLIDYFNLTDVEGCQNLSKDVKENKQQLDVEVEALKSEIDSLKNELSQYELEENERLEVFTNEQYILFEQRLKEWHTQRLEIEHQEQLFTAEKKSLTEMYEHYKNQFEYQRNQNEKVLEMHQKLLDIITSQSKTMQERNLIEAVEKNIVDKNTWKPK